MTCSRLLFGLVACVALAGFGLAATAPVPPVARPVDVSGVEKVKPAMPVIPDRTFSLSDFGATPDGKTLNTDAFKKAIAAVDKAGGGKLIVPKGEYRTLPFVLCSNLDFHLEDGAVILAPDSFTAYGIPEPETLKTQEEVTAKVKTPAPLITARNVHDLAITGTGKIDGNGAMWWAWAERPARAQPGRIVYSRPNLVGINGCQRLYVADITLTNSSKFHLVPTDITDLTIERVKVRAPFNAPNTDAIDPGPVTNALIRNCDIDTGDDDIVIKSGGTNVLIEDCTIKHGHGISIGSGTTVGIHNMLVRNCTFEGSDNGIRIKSMRGAGGPVENVRYTNIQMKNVANAIILDLNYVDNNRPDFKGDPTKIPSINGILIDNVTVVGTRNVGKITGLPDSQIKNITLRNIQGMAETDFTIKDAERPVFDNVTRTITKNAATTRAATQE